MPDFNNLSSPMVNQNLSDLPNPYNPASPETSVPTQSPSKLDATPEQSLEQFYATKPDEESSVHHVISGAELDANKRYKMYNPLIPDMENEARYGQTTGERLKNAGDNFIEKTLSYGVQTLGFLGGLVPAAVGGTANLISELGKGEGNIADGHAISLMTDNFMVKLADAWKENVQERSPIYKSDTYTQGNIWKKLGTSDWWLDDFTDRLALTAATLAPGFLEAKGLGLFGIAMKEGGIVGKGMAAKAVLAMADNPSMYGKLGKYLANNIYKAGAEGVADLGAETLAQNAAMNFKNVVRGAQYAELVTFNTVGQNALNARETQVSITKSLRDQREQGFNNYTNDEIDKIGARGAIQGFGYNLPLTLASSIFELPQIFASMRGGMNVVKDVAEKQGIEAIATGVAVAESSVPKLLPTIGKALFTGFEHGQLESSQVAIGRYIEDTIAGRIKDGKIEKNTDELLPGAIKGMIDNFSDPNGQNNIALGTIQGLLTTIFGTGVNLLKGTYANQDKTSKGFIEELNKSNSARTYFNGIVDLAEKDEKGNIKFTADNKVVWDQNKLVQLGASQIDHMTKVQAKLDAYKSNDRLALDKMNYDSLSNLAYNFFKDANGKEYLTNVLRFQANEQSKNVDRLNDVQNGVEITPHTILTESLAHVDSLYKAYNAIDQRHAGFLNLDVDYTNKEEAKLASHFTEKYKGLEYDYAADQIYLNNKLQKNQLEEAGIDSTSIGDERRAQLQAENTVLTDLLQKSKDGYKNVTNRELINNTWKAEKANLVAVTEKVKQIKEGTGDKIGQTITVTTKGDKKVDLEVGSEYMMGRVINKTADNQDVYSAPTFTVLGQQEDGLINIRTSNGHLRTIDPKDLEDYGVVKSNAAILNDKKVKFYYDNWNTPYEHYGIKINGKPAVGRIEYSPKAGILNFVYTDAKGVRQVKEVSNKLFVAKKGFVHPMINPLTPLTAAKEASTKAFAESKDPRTELARENQLKALSDIYDTVATEQTRIAKLLQDKKDDIAAVNKQLEDITTQLNEPSKVDKRFKTIQFTKYGNQLLKTARTLSKTRDQLEKELSALTGMSDEVDNTGSYLMSLIDDVEDLPIDSKQFISELKDHIDTLDTLGKETQKQIDGIHKVINSINKTIDATIGAVHDFIQKFQDKYSEGPFVSMAQTYLDVINNPNFFKYASEERRGDITTQFNEDSLALNDLIAQTEDFEITPNEQKLADLKEQMISLEKEIQDITDEQKAMSVIYDKLKTFADEQTQREKEEAIFIKDKALMDKAIGTADTKNILTKNSTEWYEAAKKKAVEFIWRSSMGVRRGLPHQERANTFGFNIEKFENRNDIRSIFITSENEKAIGLDGLMTHLATDNTGTVNPTVDQANTIAMVMIDTDGNLINEEGKPLTEEQLADALNHAIYQVMPLDDLKWSEEYGGETMFRKKDVDAEDTVREQYSEMRAEIKANADQELKNNIHTVGASFGIPKYVQKVDEKGELMWKDEDKTKPVLDYETRTPATETGLITEDDFHKRTLITIPTTTEMGEKGTTSYDDSLGRPFLELGNGLLPLQNRRQSAQEAETIYQALLRLAKNMMDPEIGLDGQSSRDLNDWLASVVYWGPPETKEGVAKEDAYNSVFWTVDNKDGFMLTISGKGVRYKYNPTDLELNKDVIVASLEKIFININNSKIKDINQSYREIQSIAPDGKITERIWLNYQAFLLADKFIPFDTRQAKTARPEIPLTTVLAPTSKQKINRTGIYFYTDDNEGEMKYPTEQKPEKPTVSLKAGKSPVSKPPVNKPSVSTEAHKPGDYVFDGTTMNEHKTPGGRLMDFTMDKTGKITIYPGKDVKAIENIYMKSVAKTNDVPILEDKNGNVFVNVGTGKEQEDNQKLVRDQARETMKEIIRDAVTTEFEDSKLAPRIEIQLEANDDTDETDKQAAKINRLFAKVKANISVPKSDLRVVKERAVQNKENWSKIEDWFGKNLPQIPVYRLRNIIQAGNGQEAWGMFKEAAIYIYQNAEMGTGFHEAFHAVWNMFATPAEKTGVISEFMNRTGSFVDRPTGKTIDYKEATPDQVKEQLAEEFKAYINEGKIPPKPKDGRPFVVKLFSDLVNTIKKLFFGTTNMSEVEKMFTNINKGKYRGESNPLSFSNQGVIDLDSTEVNENSEFSLVSISDKQRTEIIDEMIYRTLYDIIDKDESLFNVIDKNKKELHETLNDMLLQTVLKGAAEAQLLIESNTLSQDEIEAANDIIEEGRRLAKNIDKQWDKITDRYDERIKSYGIDFDENDKIQYNSPDKVRESDYVEANKVDSFKKAHSAIKLLLGTLTVVDKHGESVESSIGGVKLIPMSQAFISVMNNIHDAQSIEDMLLKLQDMAKNDPTYRKLYQRITKRAALDPGVDLDNITETHGIRLLGAFWATFKKQNPEVKNLYILENGEVVVGDANLSTAAAQLRDNYRNSIVFRAKEPNGYLKYDQARRVFVGDSAKVKLDLNKEDLPSLTKFLNNLGVEFDIQDVQKLSVENKAKFKKAALGIKTSVVNGKDIVSFSNKALDIDGQLFTLGYIQASINHPEFDSTFFNVNNERTQSFIGTNPASNFYDFISQLKTYDRKAIANSPYAYLLTDSFSQGSSILDRMFTPNDERKETEDARKLMRVVYIGGTDDANNGKHRQSSKLNQKQRLVQEVNMNLAGYYMNLVPGDASMEWAMYMGNPISFKNLANSEIVLHQVFRNYLISEINLVRDNRKNMAKLSSTKTRNAKEMRFFKSILEDPTATTEAGKNKLHNDILSSKGTAEDIYNDNETKINSAIDKYMARQNNKLKASLEEYNILNKDDETDDYTFQNIDIKGNLKADSLEKYLTALNANFMMANIEMHKLLYADPYQYADELKRIKNFNSPRQALVHDSPKMNDAYDRIWNARFRRGDIGWTNFRQDYYRSTTYKDVMGVIPSLEDYLSPFKETDGGGMISFPAYRQFRIRIGQWNDAEEGQYMYDMDYETYAKSPTATAEGLAELRKSNPAVRSAYTPIKPIVSGNKANGQKYNDILLDKFALYPLSYRLMSDVNIAGGKTTSNAIALYNKMQAENIDYVVFDNSRKVGATDPSDVYDENGLLNPTPYSAKSIINVPFSIMSVQTDVPSKDDGGVTRGSQVTKMVTMDLMEAGVPVDFQPGKLLNDRYKAWFSIKTPEEKETASDLYKQIKHNQELLKQITDEGYQSLLKQLGITEVNGRYVVEHLSEAGETLRNEILKREVNDNISDALKGFIEGKSVLEATPAYQQVKNILYSIADREVISPKINGGMKVLIPSTFFEEVRPVAIAKGVYSSDVLDFYSKSEDGKTVNYAEIMAGRWFDSDMSDAELLKYLNTTKEGQKILSGFAFRIPTQKQNSMEVFVIKQFLPKEFGDSVILPAGMVAKTGGDYDIDKLTMYLKNIYKDATEKPKLIPFYGYGEQAKTKFRELYNEIVDTKLSIAETKLAKQSRLQSLFGDIALGIGSDKTIAKWTGLFKEWFADQLVDGKLPVQVIEDIFMNRIERLNKKIDKLTDRDLQDVMEDITVEQWYKKSLQNEFIDSSQQLAVNVNNYDRLIKPNSAKQLSDLADEVARATTGKSFDYTDVGNMLDRTFMSRLRQAFVSGKYAIGIAAVNQTNHSLNQRQLIYIDLTKLKNTFPDDKVWLQDGKIMFQKYNKAFVNGASVASLSGIKNAAGQDISDIISQFVDGYVDISKGPWIMELGATPNVTSTWLFLAKIGVPIDTVAYFMNQPIVRDYLKSIEVAGYSYLFMDSFVKNMKIQYSTTSKGKLTSLPSTESLKKTMGKSVINEDTTKKLTPNEKLEQQFILDEFLKYAKMSEHLFHVTQGTNFDTASLNDPYLIFKKFKQLEKAQKTIIGNVDQLLSESFVGNLGQNIKEMREALATLLKSDQPQVREIIQKLLEPYVDMQDDDFVQLANKAVANLFDYAVQTNQSLNREITDILIKNGGVGKQIQTLMDKIRKEPTHALYDNYLVGHEGIMKAIASRKGSEEGVNNIKIVGLSKAYDQNNMIYAFRQLRDYMKEDNSNLYNRIVQLAVLQSGLGRSSMSFTSVLPHEDFENIYNATLGQLESLDLSAFNTLNIFQRENWNDDSITPYARAAWTRSKKYNPGMEFLSPKIKSYIKDGTIPQVMNIRQLSKEAKFSHMVFTWEKQMELITKENKAQYKNLHGWALLKKVKSDMRSKGDYSYINKGLFEKVTDAKGIPLETSYTISNPDGDVVVKQFVYKMINAWGDGQRANEFYNKDKESVIDNGFIKVPVKDNVSLKDTNQRIIDIFSGKKPNQIAPVMKVNANRVTEKNTPKGLPETKRPKEQCGG